MWSDLSLKMAVLCNGRTKYLALEVIELMYNRVLGKISSEFLDYSYVRFQN